MCTAQQSFSDLFVTMCSQADDAFWRQHGCGREIAPEERHGFYQEYFSKYTNFGENYKCFCMDADNAYFRMYHCRTSEISAQDRLNFYHFYASLIKLVLVGASPAPSPTFPPTPSPCIAAPFPMPLPMVSSQKTASSGFVGEEENHDHWSSASTTGEDALAYSSESSTGEVDSPRETEEEQVVVEEEEEEEAPAEMPAAAWLRAFRAEVDLDGRSLAQAFLEARFEARANLAQKDAQEAVKSHRDFFTMVVLESWSAWIQTKDDFRQVLQSMFTKEELDEDLVSQFLKSLDHCCRQLGAECFRSVKKNKRGGRNHRRQRN